MKKITDINTAIHIFKDAADRQAKAIEIGDYNQANKCYDQITKVVTFLKDNNALLELQPLLTNDSVGIRLWAACYLLRVDEKKAITVLEEISNLKGIHSLTAKTTIKEWRKGNIKT